MQNRYSGRGRFEAITDFTSSMQVQACLVLCQGYISEKCANQTQNFHLKQSISWEFRGLKTSSFIAYDYTTSGYMDL